MDGLAAFGRGLGRIVRILLFSLLFAAVAVGLFGAVAIGVRHFATIREPAAPPPPDRPVFATADEILFDAASNGAGCDQIEPFELTADGDREAPTGVTCLSSTSRIWILVFADADDRDASVADGHIARALCERADVQVVGALMAGNWVYAVAGDQVVADRAATALDLDIELTSISCV